MCASRVRRVIPVFDRLRHHSSVPANICYAGAHNRGLEWLNGWSNAALSLTGASMTAFGLTGRAALRSDSLRWCCSREGAIGGAVSERSRRGSVYRLCCRGVTTVRSERALD